MLDQMQVAPVAPLLSALLEHPEFAEGVRMANEYFFESYNEAPLSEEEMVEEVEMNLSRRIHERDKQLRLLLGDPPPSYLRNLGYAFGTIARGLTYAYPSSIPQTQETRTC